MVSRSCFDAQIYALLKRNPFSLNCIMLIIRQATASMPEINATTSSAIIQHPHFFCFQYIRKMLKILPTGKKRPNIFVRAFSVSVIKPRKPSHGFGCVPAMGIGIFMGASLHASPGARACSHDHSRAFSSTPPASWRPCRRLRRSDCSHNIFVQRILTTANIICEKSGSMAVTPCRITTRPFRTNSFSKV